MSATWLSNWVIPTTRSNSSLCGQEEEKRKYCDSLEYGDPKTLLTECQQDPVWSKNVTDAGRRKTSHMFWFVDNFFCCCWTKEVKQAWKLAQRVTSQNSGSWPSSVHNFKGRRYKMLMSSQCWSKYQLEATRGFCHKVFTNITPGTHRAGGHFSHFSTATILQRATKSETHGRG